MSENCRRACGKCGIAKSTVCSGGGQKQATTTTAAPVQRLPVQPAGGSKCNSPMCFNEDQCCPVWAFQGECRTNPTFMLCQCRVSCQQCQPQYRYGENNYYWIQTVPTTTPTALNGLGQGTVKELGCWRIVADHVIPAPQMTFYDRTVLIASQGQHSLQLLECEDKPLAVNNVYLKRSR
ncbi:shTK domain protein [Cooperia oncophora]